MNNIELLRLELANRGVLAVIVPSGDTHFSEYTAPHFQCRAWLSGFTGSAGDVAVTMRSAALFTDSRYFLQAQEQLRNGIALQKMGLADSITPAAYIKQQVSKGAVGVNAALYSAADYEALAASLAPLELRDIGDPFEEIWKDRPPLPTGAVFLLHKKFAGDSIANKLAALKHALNPPQNSIYIVAALDQTAWLLNLRGSDIKYTPEALAYSVVDLSSNVVSLFVSPKKIADNERTALDASGVRIEDYAALQQRLPALTKGRTAIYHPSFISQSIAQILERNALHTIRENSTVPCINALKSVKNPTEIAGIREAMVSDGVAWTKFWLWLEQNVDSGEVTELAAAAKLRELRAAMPNFWDESFAPIVSYGAHGAIVHYSPTPQSNYKIERGSFTLIDTGAQYFSGTTDITRTLHLGTPTTQQKKDYTLVLRGHIALQRAVFPQGTRGAQLDALARQYLWQNHLLYLHGTGHGVGHFLGVHEGPQSFRLNENPAELRAGMVTSCEPGLYRENEYGIRIENLILTTESGTSEFGSFLKFEPLTLCPYDLACVEPSLLTADEIEYINNYHKIVYTKISPYLNDSEKKFLHEKCMALTTNTK